MSRGSSYSQIIVGNSPEIAAMAQNLKNLTQSAIQYMQNHPGQRPPIEMIDEMQSLAKDIALLTSGIGDLMGTDSGMNC